MNDLGYYLLLTLCMLFNAFAQLILKKSADKGYKGIKIFINPGTVVGYFMFFLVLLSNVMLLRYIELSAVVLFESLGYIFINVLSYLILKEKLTKRRLLGMGIILSGIAVYAFA